VLRHVADTKVGLVLVLVETAFLSISKGVITCQASNSMIQMNRHGNLIAKLDN